MDLFVSKLRKHYQAVWASCWTNHLYFKHFSLYISLLNHGLHDYAINIDIDSFENVLNGYPKIILQKHNLETFPMNRYVSKSRIVTLLTASKPKEIYGCHLKGVYMV